MLRLLPLLLLLFPAACAAPAPEDPVDCWWVWIRTADTAGGVQGAALQEAMVGHFANMERLAAEGRLWAAGPLGPPRVDPRHRGIFLLAAESRAAAEELANTDPAAHAGIFTMEAESFRSADPLERLNGMHEAAVAASGVEDPPPGFRCTTYVLIAGAPADAARAAVEAGGTPAFGVCFSGTLGEGADARAVYCLDIRDVTELPAELPGGDAVRWERLPWYASESVAALRGTAE